MISVALYQPDIPQNTGALMRTCACLDVSLHIILPCGFPFSDKTLKRTGMDYVDRVNLQTHASWDAFDAWRKQEEKRLILLTTKAEIAYTDFQFSKADILLLGRESAGVPGDVHKAADAAVTIPMKKGLRSLNVATAAAMVLGESLRQMRTGAP